MTLEIVNPYTRKIDRETTKKAFLNSPGTTMDAKGNPTISMTPSDMQDANDYLVMAMTGATQADIDALTAVEFNEILAKINKMKESGSVTSGGADKKVSKAS